MMDNLLFLNTGRTIPCPDDKHQPCNNPTCTLAGLCRLQMSGDQIKAVREVVDNIQRTIQSDRLKKLS